MEVGDDGYHYGLVLEEGCSTPTHEGCRIPMMAVVCPPAPRKKRAYNCMKRQRKQRSVVPKDGYFQHPDLEILFKMMMTTRHPYVQFQTCF